MRTLQVQFVSGREVLGHYWGLLSGGGLALRLGVDAVADGRPYASGDRVRLHVQVQSVKKSWELEVQVLELRTTESGGQQLMVSFLPGEAPDEMLDAAWADGCDAPQRRSRRLPSHTPVRYERLDGGPMDGREGRLVNLSAGGCCVEGPALPPPGTQVLLTTLPAGAREDTTVKLVGRVRWTERPEGGYMGIEFLGTAPEVGHLLQSLSGPGPGEGEG